jgi:hypothetical protein
MEEYCQDRDGTALAYFYFDFQTPNKQLSSGLVRSLIIQLLNSCLEIPSFITLLFSSCKEGRDQPSFSALFDALQQLVKTFSSVYFIIDALDESIERDHLGDLIQGMHDWTIPTCHLLATSRRELDLEDKLNPIMSIQISLESNIVDSDIAKYIKFQLNHDVKLKKKPASSKIEIESVLLLKSGGM